MDVGDVVQMSADEADREYAFQVDAQYFRTFTKHPILPYLFLLIYTYSLSLVLI